MNERIENLAREKSFSQLGPTECAEVLAEMTPENYEQLHTLLRTAAALDPGPGPDDVLRARLLGRLSATGRGNTHRQYHIPLWQAAAAVIVAVTAVTFFPKPVVVHPAPATVVHRQVDTVYIEKPLWRDRIVWREKIVYRARREPVAMVPAITTDSSALLPVPGTSLAKEPALMQFFVQVR